ncbi:hypothetical protein VPH35_027179 [Triticum aestivum]
MPLLRWPVLSSASVPVLRTITMDSKGGGDFRRIQSAVNLVPHGNREWAGGYREKVTIPREKGYILLEGGSHKNTVIYFDDYAHGSTDDLMRRGADAMGTYETTTLRVYADDFVARDIAFTNTHNGVNKSKVTQALAALVDDTICDNTGRHYFHECFIKGGVDFIFGYARSIYDGCTLVSNIPLRHGRRAGWVTAHARRHAGDPGGTGRQYLGRAWNKYATIVYYHVSMSSVVVPQGWAPWHVGRETNDVLFAEVGCTGQGSNMAGRVPWEKHLTETEVEKFVDMSFIDDGWLSKQP